MKIKKMTATFGGLERATLTPGEGLTVITAPNEAGKSTWTAFLKTMLYGLDTKERDKTGHLAEKNRYQPWSGAPMAGELQVEWEGRDITLRRTSNRSGPMQQFEAVYTATGDPVPGLTGANVGQQLLGVSKEVFLRTALVGQNSTAVTHIPELESRVAALATSGEEDVSASATERTLKDWRNRRRSNRANGLIPELERELLEVERTLRDLDLARTRRDEARQNLERLAAEKADLEQEQALHRRLAARELNRRCGEAQARLESAQAELAALPPADPAFEGLTAQQARERVIQLGQQAEEARLLQEQNDVRNELLHRRRTMKNIFKILIPLLGAGGLVVAGAGFLSRNFPLLFGGIGAMMVAVVLLMIAAHLLSSMDKKLRASSDAQQPVEEVSIPDAEGYAQWLMQRDVLQREAIHCQERLDDLLAQGAQPLNTLELPPTPVRSARETAGLLSAAEREQARWQTQLDQAIGALRADPLELESRRSELEARLEQRTSEYDALDLALNVLESANAALRERFSPTLNQEAAAIFSQLTGGRYSALTLRRDFSALAGEDNRSSLYLSSGTVDQLYLAVRLALCRLSVPDSPILLDDALCAFDDDRMALALSALKELGQERQIILFSCHKRESLWARSNGVPTLEL